MSLNKILFALAGALPLLGGVVLLLLWPDDIQALVEQWGIWAPLGIVALRCSSIVFPVLPSSLYSVMAGAVLGLWPGILTIAIADLVSCSLTFSLTRRWGRPLVAKLVGERWLFRVEQISETYVEGNTFLIAAIMMTGLFDFASYAVGLTRTPAPRYGLALVIAVIVSTPPVVAIGAGLTNQGSWLLGLALLAVFTLAAATGWLQRRHQRSGKHRS